VFSKQQPKMMQGPTGIMMPVKAAEQAWEIHNREQRRLSDLRVADRARGVQTRDADTARDLAAKTRDDKAQKVRVRWARVSARLTGIAARLRNDLPLVFTLVTVAVSLTVTLAGQLMFYGALPWPVGMAWLSGPMALLVESGSWTYGIHAQYLATERLPYGKQARRMWMLALLAAGMNGFHGATAFPGHPEMGLILGGGSVLGPSTWHGYLWLTKARKSGRNGAQVRAAIGVRLHHPILSWRAHERRSVCGGRLSPEVAFLQVYREHYGYLPGQRPALASRRVTVATARVTWTPISAAPGAESSTRPSAETGARLSVTASAEPTPPTVVTGAGDDPGTPPALALVGASTGGEDTLVTDAEIETFLQSMASAEPTPDSALNERHNPSSEALSAAPVQRSGRRPVSAEHDPGSARDSGAGSALTERDNRGAGERRRPVGSKRRRAAAKTTNAALVRAYVEEQLADGVALNELNGTTIAEALKIGQSTARNELAKIKAETPRDH
jgi:hypothetical protein